jgi:adenylate cyclase
VFALSFVEAGEPGSHELREGTTLIGRASTCDIVISAPTISRQHARIRLEDGRVFVSDAGSTFGTIIGGEPITNETELVAGNSFVLGHLEFTLIRDVEESDLLSDDHQVLEESSTIIRRVDGGPASGPYKTSPSNTGDEPAISPPESIPTPRPPGINTMNPAGEPRSQVSSGSMHGERRHLVDRRKVNLGRATGDRRSGRDRRGGRLLRLLSDIARTLVTVQPIEQVLTKVVDLLFDVVPAERAFLLLRDSWDQPLTARVIRSRDGSAIPNVTISRTVVNHVMRDRVAILAKDARYDSRLDASASIQVMNIRSFMCAPLWNRNDVIGVLYCDNPRSKQFVEEDLEIFTALCNYAAVAIEQARLAQQLLEETKRRERLQRYHSPGVVNRILHSETSLNNSFITQERDVTVMFTDIVGFTKICEHMAPAAVGELLNDYFGRMADVVFEHEGTLDKFIGDAILAVFGAPFDQPDHAERAVAAALDMRGELARFNAGRPGDPIEMRIAINSGRALTGDLGSSKRKEFTILGDVVNTASRLESNVCQPDQIVISESTRAQLGRSFDVKSLGSFSIRGRQSKVEAFEVLGSSDSR